MSNRFHITLAQINPVVGDLPHNAETMRRIFRDAPQDADLVAFPELALCGYPPEDLVLKSRFLDKIEEEAKKLAAATLERPGLMMIPCPWRQDGRIFNAVHIAGGGRIQATIFKRHLPNYGVFDEARIFSPGTESAAIDINGCRAGIMICEDMWFSDVAADLKKSGAEILIAINASPFENGKRDTRLRHAQSRARETGLPLIYLNQWGGQDELVFDGTSFALNPNGEITAQAAEFTESVMILGWQRTAQSSWRCEGAAAATPLPEPEAVYSALMLGLRDYVAKNGFPGVIIGMSGGIDSALSAAIAADALGPEAVHCVMMPSKFTSADSLEDAASCSRLLGVRHDSISIETAVAAFETQLAPYFDAATPATTHENIQPRCRGLILMALSNASGKMVLSTGNKSEMAVGYATLYGDMCGGFNVLKDVYKTQVYALARWRNTHKPADGKAPKGGVIPERILIKAPTAELKPNQTDQDTLPPYAVLDDILRGLIEDDLGIAEIAARGHDPATVRRVWRMLDMAEYKRRQAPPGVKITARAFGRDRRYPITSRFTKIIEK